MALTTAVVLGSAVIGAVGSSIAAGKQAKGVAAGIGEQRRQFDLNRADLAPFRESGVSALGRLNQLAEGDTSGFFTSPGFELVGTILAIIIVGLLFKRRKK